MGVPFISRSSRTGSNRYFVILAFAFACAGASTQVSADLAQLGDAMADVVTLGAWGQSRDLANAEIEGLKLRFKEELQRAKNVTAASIATARIEEKANDAINTRYVGQELLKVVATIDVLTAQLKEVVVERYKVNSGVTRFDDWFDTFVTQKNDQLEALVDIFQAVAPTNDQSMRDVLEATRLAKLQSDKDVQAAKAYLKETLQAANSQSVTKAMESLVNVRGALINLLENQRQRLRDLIVEMHAQDNARRTLCAPPDTIGVACEPGQVNCRYYSPDPSRPLPCNDLVYLNAFPVAAVKAIYDNPAAYAANAEFFIRLERLGTVELVSLSKFRSPEEVFGDILQPSSLLPEPFLKPQGCGNFVRIQKRLLEGFDYARIFAEAQDRSAAARMNVAGLLELRPLVEFWLDGFASSIPTETSCTGLPVATRAKLQRLTEAVTAIEAFGSALTSGPPTFTENPNAIKAVKTLAYDF